ncbi:MAG: phosphoribosyltransferase family protein [Candidatus Shapirobacteria bacterium]
MFKNRNDAGQKLALKIKEEENLNFSNTIIVSLPRGGTVIGAALAALLDLPHYPLVIRKISLKLNPELAIGAIGQTPDSLFLNKKLINELGADQEEVNTAIKAAQKEIKEIQERTKFTQLPDLKNKEVIITDDGAATGATLLSALRQVKKLRARKTIIALPVAPADTVSFLKKETDRVIVLLQPKMFFSVSEFYQDFPQVSWDEVGNLLKLQEGLPRR